MAHNIEPMDVDHIDSDFDNKENNFHHNNVLPCTEKGYEELDVSELNMKLRYSITPASSPMSKSYTAHCLDNRNSDACDDSSNPLDNINLTRSFNAIMTKTENMPKPFKVLPLQSHQAQHTLDNNRNNSALRTLDTFTDAQNNLPVIVTPANDEGSFPSTSSSLVPTPEATTPTKEVPKSGSSPIMRGIKSVLNMFRSSPSPIPAPENECDVAKHDISSNVDMSSSKSSGDVPQVGLASTPIALHKNSASSKRNSPLKDSVVFNDDLEKELEWKDETTIFFNQEKIPVHKLIFQNTKRIPPLQNKETEKNVSDKPNDCLDATVTEYMDISFDDMLTNNANESLTDVQSDGEFLDCETIFMNHSDILKNDNNLHENTKPLDVSNLNINIEGVLTKNNANHVLEPVSQVASTNNSKECLEVTKANTINMVSGLSVKELSQDKNEKTEQLDSSVTADLPVSKTIFEDSSNELLTGVPSIPALKGTVKVDQLEASFTKIQEVFDGTVTIGQGENTSIKESQDACPPEEIIYKELTPSTFVKNCGQGQDINSTVIIDQTEAKLIKNDLETSLVESADRPLTPTVVNDSIEMLDGTVIIKEAESANGVQDTFISESIKQLACSTFIKENCQEVLEAKFINDGQETFTLAEPTNKAFASKLQEIVDQEDLDGTVTIDQDTVSEFNNQLTSSTFIQDVSQKGERLDGTVTFCQAETFINNDEEIPDATNKISTLKSRDIGVEKVIDRTIIKDTCLQSSTVKDITEKVPDKTVIIDEAETTFIKNYENTSACLVNSNKTSTSNNHLINKDFNETVILDQGIMTSANASASYDMSESTESSNKQLMSSTFIKDIVQDMKESLTIEEAVKLAPSRSYVEVSQNVEDEDTKKYFDETITVEAVEKLSIENIETILKNDGQNKIDNFTLQTMFAKNKENKDTVFTVPATETKDEIERSQDVETLEVILQEKLNETIENTQKCNDTFLDKKNLHSVIEIAPADVTNKTLDTSAKLPQESQDTSISMKPEINTFIYLPHSAEQNIILDSINDMKGSLTIDQMKESLDNNNKHLTNLSNAQEEELFNVPTDTIPVCHTKSVGFSQRKETAMEIPVAVADNNSKNETVPKIDNSAANKSASNFNINIQNSNAVKTQLNYEKSAIGVQQVDNNETEQIDPNNIELQLANTPADIPLPDEDEQEISSTQGLKVCPQFTNSIMLPDILNILHTRNNEDVNEIDEVPNEVSIQAKTTGDIIDKVLLDKEMLDAGAQDQVNSKISLNSQLGSVSNQQTVVEEINMSTAQIDCNKIENLKLHTEPSESSTSEIKQISSDSEKNVEKYNNVEEISVSNNTLADGAQHIEPMDTGTLDENIITDKGNLSNVITLSRDKTIDGELAIMPNDELKMNEKQIENKNKQFSNIQTSEHPYTINEFNNENQNISVEQMDVDTTLDIHDSEVIQNIKDENIREELIVSENNSPYVLVSVSKETSSSLDDDFEKIESFEPTTKLSPPVSPKIVSKGYNFNFDEIEDPFATKTKIRLSPPLDSPKQSLQIEDKKGNSAKNITDKNKRKSQPERNKSVITNKFTNKTFNADTSIRKTALKKSEIDMKIQEVASDFNIDNDTKQSEPIRPEKSEASMQDNDISTNIDKSESEINVDNESKLDNAILDKLHEVDIKLSDTSTTPSSSEQSAYYSAASAATSSGDSTITRNVFNLPEIDDMNFSFATKSKVRHSPQTETRMDDCFGIKTNMHCLDNSATTEKSVAENIPATLDIEAIQTEFNKSGAENKDIFNGNNTTCSSKAADEKDVTVREVHTDDEDTIEGPFLEAEDLYDEKMSCFDGERMMQFADLPAQSNEENELFIDAEAFEFLLNQNKSNAIADSGKESLFLKFDPLFAKRMSSDGVLAALNQIQKRQSTPKKTTPITATNIEKSFTGPSTSKDAHEPNPEESADDLNVTTSKPTMVVTPAVNPVVVPRKSTTPTSSNRRSITFTSPAIAVIDRLLSLSANNSLLGQETPVTQVSREQNEAELALTQLRELLAEKEIHVYNLRSESKELKDRLTVLETEMKTLELESKERLRKVNDLNEKFSEKTKINKSMAAVVEEYERTIASLIAETEQDKKRHNEERIRLIKERDEQTAHLTSMEVSFSDLHSKYEKSKQVILSCKANEDAYKKSIKDFEENLTKMQNNYELLKQHATSKLNHANQELEKMNRAHESEVLKLNAMIKRKDLHITSLEETLAQKTKANEELTAICDELINKVG